MLIAVHNSASPFRTYAAILVRIHVHIVVAILRSAVPFAGPSVRRRSLLSDTLHQSGVEWNRTNTHTYIQLITLFVEQFTDIAMQLFRMSSFARCRNNDGAIMAMRRQHNDNGRQSVRTNPQFHPQPHWRRCGAVRAPETPPHNAHTQHMHTLELTNTHCNIGETCCDTATTHIAQMFVCASLSCAHLPPHLVGRANQTPATSRPTSSRTFRHALHVACCWCWNVVDIQSHPVAPRMPYVYAMRDAFVQHMHHVQCCTIPV